MKAKRTPTRGAVLSLVMLLLGVGCGKEKAEAYFPLKEGRAWDYQVSLTQGEHTATSAAAIRNLASRVVRNKAVTSQQADMFGQSQLRFIAQDRTGICELAGQAVGALEPVVRERPNCVLKHPIRADMTWESSWQSSQFGQQLMFPATKTIESIHETVTVPAGTFKNVVKLTITGRIEIALPTATATINVEGYEWYAPNVGYVKGVFREHVGAPGQPTELVLELTGYQG